MFRTWKKEVKLHCSPIALQFRRYYESLYDEGVQSLRLKILSPFSVGYIAGVAISTLPEEFAGQKKAISYSCLFTYRTAFGFTDGTRCHNGLITSFRNYDYDAEEAMKLGTLDFEKWRNNGGEPFGTWYDYIKL